MGLAFWSVLDRLFDPIRFGASMRGVASRVGQVPVLWRSTALASQSIPRSEGSAMKIKVVVHEAEEGGYWAEVPAIPGCATQGESMEELLRNVHEAIEGCLSVDIAEPEPDEKAHILEIAV
jgi:predicted RNase H-like HicB family nuclease